MVPSIGVGCRVDVDGWGWKETPWCWSPGMRHARKLARLAPNQMPSAPPNTTTTNTTLTLFSLSHERQVPSPTPPFLSSLLSLSPPQPMKQESCHLRFLRQDQRSLCPGLRTDGIPSPCCCCCCWPAVAAGIQNRSVTSAWLLEYANVPRIKRTQRIDTHTVQTKNTSRFIYTNQDKGRWNKVKPIMTTSCRGRAFKSSCQTHRLGEERGGCGLNTDWSLTPYQYNQYKNSTTTVELLNQRSSTADA